MEKRRTQAMLGRGRKRGRKKGALVFNSNTYRVLKIIAGAAAFGIALSTFMVAPNLVRVAAPLFKGLLRDAETREWRKEREKIRRAIRQLHERRLVEYAIRRGETFLKITQKGKSVYRKFDIECVVLP